MKIAAALRKLARMDDPRRGSPLRCDVEIFIVSALILYLELVLIRWIGTEIRIFAYLGNLILVVCFFGVGLGCYRAEDPASTVRIALNITLLVILVANPLHIELLNLSNVTYLLSGFEDAPIWQEGTASVVEFTTGAIIIGILLYLLTYTFVPLGQILGRTMQRAPQVIRAYSANIAGSLAGVWLFNGLSWASTPPPVWILVAAALLALTLLASRTRPWCAVGLVVAGAGAAWLGGRSSAVTIWSPYQKLSVSPYMATVGTNQLQRGYFVQVNGTVYQAALDLSDRFVAAHPEVFAREKVDRNHYNVPFDFKPDARRVLIVGAGTGNNAAAALRHGVEHVDCAEIDPQIYALGQRIHPEQPYSSPRVRMIVNDARAFFKQASGTYDLIWFGWLDAHTLGSSYNNMRLDHYVYTLESFREARRLLAPGGVLVVNFAAQRMWIADRLFNVLRQVFGHDPFVYSEELAFEKVGLLPTVTLVIGEHEVSPRVIQNPALRDFVTSARLHLPGTTRPTTDDWPYLYLKQAEIPKLHLIVSASILAAVMVTGRRTPGMKGGSDWHFFALGAAFLLLEVQTVSRATLLFGMTWIVNAIVISAVLVMILFANLVAWRWPRLPQSMIIAGLAITVAALALVPLDWFNTLAGATKLVAASAFLTAPVFFAGLIFIQSFATCPDKARALGSNLIGALVGGLLESLSFVTGIRALVILVGLFYLVAILCRPAAVRR
ncbi:MAG TPA: methyltransferase domain-containing protein [Verrucomicrobiae bacterium]|nr:methyltransferase domain-containing protein [Verrucomicrobiae bacterium]